MSEVKQTDQDQNNKEHEELVETNDKAHDVESEETNEEINSQEESAEERIAQLEKQLKESEDKYYRVHADFDNIKKRLEREKYQGIEYASEKFASDLLTSLDSLQMALNSAKNDGVDSDELLTKLVEGVELTQKQLLSALDKNGVKEIDCSGELDPNIHEAVMRVDSDEVESGHIAQVLQKGYIYKERTLRAAMVSVAN